MDDSYKTCQKHYQELLEAKIDLEEKRDCEKEGTAEFEAINAEIQVAIKEINQFIEEKYAKAIFEFYSKKKPKLIRTATKEVYSWDDAFGTDYGKIEKGEKHSLVGLVEGGGKYSIKKSLFS